MNTILIAPNSFKECIDSVSLTALIKEKIQNKLSDKDSFNFLKAPISDGGDGFHEVCTFNFNLEKINYKIAPPFSGDKFNCAIGYSENEEKVFIESAKVLGLNLVPVEKRNPFFLNSCGLGEILNKIKTDVNAEIIKVKKVIIGVGGTSTVDMGIGLLSELGLELFDSHGNLLEPFPANYGKVSKFSFIDPELPFEIETIVDVNNKLMGEEGAIRIYGPQKGVKISEIDSFEKGFENLLNVFRLPNKRVEKLSGAGGGIPAGMELFLNTRIKFSKDFILEDLHLKEKIKNSDIIITGEGKYDSQSGYDKGVGVIINASKQSNALIFVVAGKADDILHNSSNIMYIQLQDFFPSVEESIKNIEMGIEKASEIILNEIKNNNYTIN